MSPQETLTRLDELIARRSILEHPFYVAWTCGELSREQLASYAAVYYPHVAAFPGYLEAALESANDPAVRAEIEENLAEERAVPKAHDALWLDFAAGLGLDRDAVASAEPTAGTAVVVDTFRRLSAGPTAGALAALYAYESQQPEVARRKADDLAGLYGVTDPASLAYFEVHAEADVRHRAGERAAIGRCLADGASGEQVLEAASEALDAYWKLLDEVCSETGIAAG